MSAFCILQQDWPQNYRQPEGLELFPSQKGWAGDIGICPKYTKFKFLRIKIESYNQSQIGFQDFV